MLMKLALAGEGGQGVQTVGEILATAAYNAGRQALYIPNFGVEQRGGVSIAFVQVDDAPIAAPKFRHADVAVALSDRATERVATYVGPQTTLVYDTSAGELDPAITSRAGRTVALPAIETAHRELTPRVFNMIILGAILGLAPVASGEAVSKAVEEELGYKFITRPELRELNYRALERGKELAGDNGGRRQEVGGQNL